MIIERNSPIPQYFQLQNWLVEQIEQGIFKPDDKIPTEEELTRITGLARATIRQALHNLVNMGYLTRKRGLGTFVIKRSADTEKNTIIGVLVPDIRSGYAPELARGAGDEAANSKHSVILCNTDDLFVKADFHADRLIEHAVSGVIFVPTASHDDRNRSIVEKFQKNNISVVLADRQISSLDTDFVTTDNLDGAYELTKYLVLHGHRRIAIILSTLFSTERKRLEGYKNALSDFNIPFDSSIVFTNEGPFIESRYVQYARQILDQKEKISAIFAGHDRIAYLVYSLANERGIRIPEDISLVGYDDLPFSNTHHSALTTMHQPIYETGQESMKLILSRTQGDSRPPQHIVLKSHLVERASVLSKI